MAGRIRTIKPEIHDDEKTAGLDHLEWRLFVSLWSLADDYGNLRSDPDYIRGQVLWKTRESRETVFRALETLVNLALLAPYMVREQEYLHIAGWDKHQKVNHPGKPRMPGPEDSDTEPSRAFAGIQENLKRVSGDSQETLLPDLRSETKTKDQSGKPDALPGLENPVQSEDRPPIPDPVRLLAETACAEINRLTESKFKPTSKSVVTLCTALWKAKHTTDEVKLVVADKVREWRGNPEMRRRLVPGTLLALSNFEKYLDELQSRPGANPPARASPTAPWTGPPVNFFTSDDEDDGCPDS